jgi:Rhs element Vgr protein
MADSPVKNSEGDLRLTVLSEGAALADSIAVLSVEVTRAINKIPSARIVIADDSDVDVALRLTVSDSDALIPGKAIQIKAGYGLAETVIFTGVVIKHAVRVGALGRGRLVVECRDKAVAMTVGRKCANFVDLADSDIIAKLIAAYSGLSADVEATSVTHKELVQYDVSDWDFMLARAEANGLVALIDAGKLSLKAPATDGAAVLSVSYGIDLIDFDAELDARSQLAGVDSVAWDPATQALLEQNAKAPTLNAQGNLDAGALAKVLGLASYRLQAAVPLDTGALKAWAAGRQLRAGLARVRGRMRFQGSALAVPGTIVQVAGVGKRFDGDTFVSAVTHTVADGDWITEAEFGLAPESLAERHELATPRAAGLTAGVSGLLIGVVKKLDQDPDQQYKIQVSVPVMQADVDGVWARLASYYGSSGLGSFFIPEIGDEVVLGFLNSDPSYPIILGSLYSSQRKPPYELTADNFTKAIMTRSKLTIEFDDDKKIITIVTPGKNKILLSDDAKSIELHDQNNNSVTLTSDGITLSSPKDIVLSAKGKITLDAVANIEIASKADVEQKGMNVTLTGSIGLTAKGTASAELSATGQTTVKGAMVMIN